MNIDLKLRSAFPYTEDRVEVFIDGSNLFATLKSLQMTVDFYKLRNLLLNHGRVVRLNYYTAMLPSTEINPLKPLVDWLSFNGYNCVLKDAKQYDNGDGERKIKGNVDIELAVDALTAADHVDHVVLFTGDGDFVSLVKALQAKRVRVTAISSTQTKPAPMCSDDLRQQVDNFIELNELRELVGKD